MRSRVAALAVCLVVLGAAASAGAESDPPDPAGIAGTWQSRTESTCGSVEGIGKVWFGWSSAHGRYDDRGMVHWADSGSTIRWWGHARFDASTRRLRASVDNSLGDHVESTWEIHGDPPERLVVRWSQTNGCRGVGIATRPEGSSPR